MLVKKAPIITPMFFMLCLLCFHSYSQKHLLKESGKTTAVNDTIVVVKQVQTYVYGHPSKYEEIGTIISWFGPIVSIITLFFLYRTLVIARNQIASQQEIAKENLENAVALAKENHVNSIKIAKENHINSLKILRLSTNTNITNELHFRLMDHPEFLKFHSTSLSEIQKCELEIEEFVYILNSLLASEFYYDDFTSSKKILKDFSHYRMQFLAQPQVEAVWNNIIKQNWTMAPFFVKAIDTFYKDKSAYINLSQGTALTD